MRMTYEEGYMKAMNDVMDYLTEIDCEETKQEILHRVHTFCMEARPYGED